MTIVNSVELEGKFPVPGARGAGGAASPGEAWRARAGDARPGEARRARGDARTQATGTTHRYRLS